MPRYRRYFDDKCWVFLTVTTGQRQPWIRPASSKRLVHHAFGDAKRRLGFRHLAHVILDDHIHWLLIAETGARVPDIVSAFKREVCFSRKQKGLGWNRLWQPRYYDHILRDEQDLYRHLDYIHYNPVKHGYVAMACQYRWSSFHAWVERGQYEPTWGTSEPPHISDMNPE